MTEGSRKAIFAAFLANLGIAIAKFVGFLITSSAGLLAEAIHSLADTGNQGLLMLGGKRAERKPDAEHPFGYGRERYFWAFVVALVLFSMGGLFALYEGISKLRHPHEVENLPSPSSSCSSPSSSSRSRCAPPYQEANKHKARRTCRGGGTSAPIEGTRAAGRAARGRRRRDRPADGPRRACSSPTSPASHAGTPSARSASASCSSPSPIVLAVEMKGLLIGESASDDNIAALNAAITSSPPVRGVIHMRTEHLGPDELLVAAKVEFDPELSMAELAAAIDGAEVALRRAVPIARLVYIEPDVLRRS